MRTEHRGITIEYYEPQNWWRFTVDGFEWIAVSVSAARERIDELLKKPREFKPRPVWIRPIASAAWTKAEIIRTCRNDPARPTAVVQFGNIQFSLPANRLFATSPDVDERVEHINCLGRILDGVQKEIDELEKTLTPVSLS